MPCTPGPSNRPEIPRRDPLFLPTSSQLSVAEEAAIRSSGLGIEDMDKATFEAMMDGDAEEIGPDLANSQEATFTLRSDQPDSFELVEDVEMAPSQSDSITSRASHKVNELSWGIFFCGTDLSIYRDSSRFSKTNVTFR